MKDKVIVLAIGTKTDAGVKIDANYCRKLPMLSTQFEDASSELYELLESYEGEDGYDNED